MVGRRPHGLGSDSGLMSHPMPKVSFMDALLVFVMALVSGAALALLYARGRPSGPRTDEVASVADEVRRLGESMNVQASGLGQRLEGIDARMNVSQSSTAELVAGISDSLADVRRATVTVADQAREFTALQDLLRAPKARGGIGEAMLEELLRQVLPPQGFSMQHRFRSGLIVDAVVRIGGRIVCIDSKFPLANYRRMCEASDDIERALAERALAADIAKHVRDISSRYVVPDEGTFDFAVMYVPAEGVYAEVLRLAHRKTPLFEMAIEQRVVPMSPLNMYGYLQTVLYGLKCLSIERSAEQILDRCGRLQQDFGLFADHYETLGRHLTNARSKYEEGAARLDRFRDKLEGVVDLADEKEDLRRTLETRGDPAPVQAVSVSEAEAKS